MKISDLLESAADIKILITLIGYDLSAMTIRSTKIKEQYIGNPTPIFKEGMITFLSSINMELFQLANLPQWERWIETEDGQEVMNEINSLYYENEDFMKKHR